MTSKEKRDKIVKEVIKPLIKEAGYNCSGNTWYSQREDCYVVIRLQNLRWNLEALGFQFCFNISVLPFKDIDNIDEVKKWVNDPSMVEETIFLPNYGILHKYHNEMGYKIDGCRNNLHTDTNIEDFSDQIINDFKVFILPKLKLINTTKEWLQMKEELRNNLNTKEFYLLSYYSRANYLAFTFNNWPHLKKYQHDLNLTSDEIRDNIELLKEVQKYADDVYENAEEFIMKSLRN